jgi:elongation factor P
VELADLEREVYQYSWNDGNIYVFLNTVTFEEVQLLKSDVDKCEYLIEGQEVKLLKFRDRVIGVELPNTSEYVVKAINDSNNGR